MCAVVAFAPSAAAQDEPPILSLLGTTSVELVVDDDAVTVEIPIRFAADVESATVSPSVLGAFNGSVAVADATTRFVVSLSEGDAPPFGTLELVVDTEERLDPGTYRIIVALAAEDRSATIDLNVVIPTGSARSLQTVSAEAVMRWPGDDRTTVTDLVLLETSDKSRLTDLTVSAIGLAGPDDTTAAGGLEVRGDLNAIDAGGTGTIELEIAGDIAKGSTTGTLLIDARELDQPLELPFTIERRWTQWYIPFFTMLGLAFGSATLAGLGRLIDKGKSLEAVVALKRRVADLTAGPSDQTMRTALKAADDRLDGASELKPAGVDTLVTTETTFIDGVVTAYETRVATVGARIDALTSLATSARALPSWGRNSLRSLGVQLPSVSEHLATGAADEASATLDGIEAAMGVTVSGHVSGWVAGQKQLLSDLGTIELAPTDLGARDDLLTAAGEALDNARGAAARDINGLVGAVATATESLHDVIRWAGHLEIVVKQSLQILRPHASEAVVVALQDAVTILTTELDELDGHGDDGLSEGVAAALLDISLRLETAIVSIVPAAKTAERAAVISSYESYGARKAASEALTHADATRSIRHSAGGPERVATKRDFRADIAPMTSVHRVGTPAPRPPRAAPIAQALAQARLAEVARWVLIAVTILGLSWFMFADGWVGTPTDIAKVVFWAWGLDIAATTLTAQVGAFATKSG
ncbi:MAG: hypothetical protein GY708_07530 [Actinomycetia bacterium]|nr:hypothetical protein [Actinomycetes bacterium]